MFPYFGQKQHHDHTRHMTIITIIIINLLLISLRLWQIQQRLEQWLQETLSSPLQIMTKNKNILRYHHYYCATVFSCEKSSSSSMKVVCSCFSFSCSWMIHQKAFTIPASIIISEKGMGWDLFIWAIYILSSKNLIPTFLPSFSCFVLLKTHPKHASK